MDPAGQRGRLSAGLGPAARTRAASGRQQQRSYRLPPAATLSLSFVVKGGAPSQQRCHARAPSHRHARNPHVGCVSAQPARRTSIHDHRNTSTGTRAPGHEHEQEAEQEHGQDATENTNKDESKNRRKNSNNKNEHKKKRTCKNQNKVTTNQWRIAEILAHFPKAPRWACRVPPPQGSYSQGARRGCAYEFR